MTRQAARLQVYEIVQKAVDAGLIYLSAGNVSVRCGEDAVAITPAGVSYDVLRPEQIAIVSMDGKPLDAPFAPSSETPMHTHLLREFEHIGAVVHTHSRFAVTFAMLGDAIPPVNLELFFVGAPLPVAPWACPGTDAPGVEAAALLRQRPELQVVLLRNHGLLAVGESLHAAYAAAVTAEHGMQTYHQSLQIGEPQSLTAAQMQAIRERYSSS